MKQYTLILLLTTFSNLFSWAQYSLHVFPLSVSGDSYADTIINTRAILMKAGVRRIEAYQTLPELTKTFATKTVHLNNKGYVDNVQICFAKNESNNFTLCIFDTILYDHFGRIVEVKSSNNKKHNYLQRQIQHIGANTEEQSLIEEYVGDSLKDYRTFKNGQLIGVKRILKGQEIENSSFYYNADGLLDSSRNTSWGTFIFKRSKKGKNKIIEMSNYILSYKWIYNSYGQCIRSITILKDVPNIKRFPDYKGDLRNENNYYFNENGTLSKVVTKCNAYPTSYTMHYSYF